MKESDVVVITQREIYDRVVATEGKVDQLLAALDPVRQRVEDHESRIKTLEAERLALAPIIAAYPEASKVINDLRLGEARTDWLPRLALGLLGAVLGGVMLWAITRGA